MFPYFININITIFSKSILLVYLKFKKNIIVLKINIYFNLFLIKSYNII